MPGFREGERGVSRVVKIMAAREMMKDEVSGEGEKRTVVSLLNPLIVYLSMVRGLVLGKAVLTHEAWRLRHGMPVH